MESRFPSRDGTGARSAGRDRDAEQRRAHGLGRGLETVVYDHNNLRAADSAEPLFLKTRLWWRPWRAASGER